MLKGTSPDGQHYYPAFPYTSYQRMAPTTCATCSPTSKRCRRCRTNRKPHDVPFPFNIRRTLGGWKFLFLDGKPFAARSSQGRGVESRRLSRQRAGPLRRMPFAAQCSGRHHREPALCRRAGAGRRRLRAEHHAEGPEHVARGARQVARDRRDAGRRHGRRRDGQGDCATPRKLSAEDRAAIATYVKSLPPVEGPKRPEPK